MGSEKYIEFYSHRKRVITDIDSIVYVFSENGISKIHTVGGECFETRMTLAEIEEKLEDGFVKVKRNALVKISEIESVTDCIHLKDGEKLMFSLREKQRIIDEVLSKSAK